MTRLICDLHCWLIKHVFECNTSGLATQAQPVAQAQPIACVHYASCVVCLQGSLSTLARVAAPDMTLIDGTGILHGPLTVRQHGCVLPRHCIHYAHTNLDTTLTTAAA